MSVTYHLWTILLWVALASLLVGCTGSPKHPMPGHSQLGIQFSSEELAVYECALGERHRSVLKLYHETPKCAVVLDSTIPGFVGAIGFGSTPETAQDLSWQFRSRHEQYWPQLTESFREKNRRRYRLPTDSLHIAAPLHVLPDSVWRRFFFSRAGGGYYDSLYRRFPRSSGLILLSRVGFDSEHMHAVLYCEHWQDMLAGVGEYILFERTPARSWKLIERAATRVW